MANKIDINTLDKWKLENYEGLSEEESDYVHFDDSTVRQYCKAVGITEKLFEEHLGKYKELSWETLIENFGVPNLEIIIRDTGENTKPEDLATCSPRKLFNSYVNHEAHVTILTDLTYKKLRGIAVVDTSKYPIPHEFITNKVRTRAINGTKSIMYGPPLYVFEILIAADYLNKYDPTLY